MVDLDEYYSEEGQKKFYKRIEELKLKVRLWGNFSDEMRVNMFEFLENYENKYAKNLEVYIKGKKLEELRLVRDDYMKKVDINLIKKDRNGFAKYMGN